MSEIICKRGSDSQREELMDAINLIFRFTKGVNDFEWLLPKLYREEYHPAKDNYLVLEEGHIRAAVGAYDLSMRICGETLRGRGIGNVGVHPAHRSRGFMKLAMNSAIEDMIKDGVDFSFLGGRRQRYRYFFYDRAGILYSYTIQDQNIRHTVGSDYQTHLTVRKLTPADKEMLTAILTLNQSQPLRSDRPQEKLFHILSSWQAMSYVAFRENGSFAGYAVLEKESISEAFAAPGVSFRDLIIELYRAAEKETLSVWLPEFRVAEAKELADFAESVTVRAGDSFSVLNYRHVLETYLRLKATYTALPDGEWKVLIHGRAGDENLCITVQNGIPTVANTVQSPAAEFSHLDAMAAFFAPVSPLRFSCPAHVRAWLPLPLWVSRPDQV